MTRDLQIDKKDQTTRAHSSVLQRKSCKGRDPETVPPIVREVLGSPGQPLDSETRAYFEPRFGHDFSHVRVHSNANAAESARAVNALAYTVGHDVVLGAPGGGRPGNPILAHELTHVVQQSASLLMPGPSAIDPSAAAEHEAELSARAVSSGGTWSVWPSTTALSLQRAPAGRSAAFAGLPLERAIEQMPNMDNPDALEVLKTLQAFILTRINIGQDRIRQLTDQRAESFGNYLIGGTIEFFGLTSLPSESWEKAWKPLNQAYGTIRDRQVKESLDLLVDAMMITNDYWRSLNDYLDKTDAGADRSIFALQALQAAGAVAATALTGGGATAVAVGAGYAATQNFAGQATAVSIGIQKEIDWGGMAFDTLFGVLTGALGGKVGNSILKRLVTDPKTSSLGRVFLSEIATDLVSGQTSTILQTAARQLYDQLRGKEQLTIGEFFNRLLLQLFDPKQMFLDAVVGRAAKIAPKSPKGAAAASKKKPIKEPSKGEPEPHILEPVPVVKPTDGKVAMRPEASAAEVSVGKQPKVSGKPFWRRKIPEVAGVLEAHPDFPQGNLMVESGIPGLEIKAVMRHLETTPQGELIAQKIRDGELHLIITSESIAEGYAGMAMGKEMHATWAGSVEETVSTLIHEGTHCMEPDLSKVGTPEGSSRLSIEGSARAFEYEQRLQDKLPAYDLAEQAHREAHDRVLRGTGDPYAANIAADKAMIKAMQQNHERYGVEPPAAKRPAANLSKGIADIPASLDKVATPVTSPKPAAPSANPVHKGPAKAKATLSKTADATDRFLAERKVAKDLIRQKLPVPESQVPDLVSGRRMKRSLSREIMKARRTNQPLHPLDKLADQSGKFQQSTAKGVDEQRWLEDPTYLELGHVKSAKHGGTKRILMTAYKNRLLSAQIEHASKGGAVEMIPQVLEIGKYSVDIDTALDLLGAGKITLQDIKNARLIQLFL